MKGDFTRLTFKKKNHYNSVRMQQGRVQMDSDWNEQMDIQAHLRETQTKDVIGLTGYPKNNGGFSISVDNVNHELNISEGRIYVDGILCELEEDITYTNQTDFPIPPENTDDPLKEFSPGVHLVYLDVWQRHITALEDEYIREKALGGPDTTTRVQTIWQVKLQDTGNVATCHDVAPGWQQGATKSTGTLQARAEPGDPPEPCILPPTAGYQRLENQLYRVEIHKSGIEGSNDNPTFKWSRDNGSVTAKVKSISGSLVEISHPVLGRLEEFAPGRWIEVTDDIHELLGKPGTLVKIDNVDGNILTVSPAPPTFSEEHNRKIRLWNSEGEVNLEVDNSTNDGYLKLEDGVEIRFEAGETYKTGDYWLIPARTATDDIEWPAHIEWPEDSTGNPIAKSPDGIKHHYCKLALVEIGIVNSKNSFTAFIEDCRPSFPPLNEIQTGKGCCTVTVGDGDTSHGDTDSLQEAIGKVLQGGQICLLPGVHKANVNISGGKNIRIIGCGEKAIVHPNPDEENGAKPVISIENSRDIQLENMSLVTATGTAIQVEDGDTTNDSKGISITHNRIISSQSAVKIRVDNRIAGGNAIRICDNQIGMIDKSGGQAAISCSADDVLISGNRIVTLSIPTSDDIADPRDPEDISIDAYKTDIAAENLYTKALICSLVEQTFLYVSSAVNFLPKVTNATGGIQITGGSDYVKIVDNLIIGGAGNGISLGVEGGEFEGFIYEMAIEGNTIKSMKFNGIGPANYQNFNIRSVPIVENFTVSRNIIEHCAWHQENNLGGDAAIGGIVLATGENVAVHDNRIENNGESYEYPICGIYIIYGENIDIKGNRIVNNGPLVSGVTNTDIRSGKRGGIVIDKCVSFNYLDVQKAPLEDLDMENISLAEVIGEFGLPALQIHDNVVIQPLGHALSVTAKGPVSVVNNQFTSQDINIGSDWQSILAGTVYIFNLGISQNCPAMLLSFFNIFGSMEMRLSDTLDLKDILIALINAYLGIYCSGGNVLFSNNQTTLELRGKETAAGFPFEIDFALSSIFIFAMDDVGFMGNQSDCNFFIDLLFTNTAIFAVTARTCNNRFEEGLIFSLFSLLSIALVNSAAFNQATHCLYARGLKEPQGDTGNIVLFSNPFCEMFSKWLDAFFKFKDQE